MDRLKKIFTLEYFFLLLIFSTFFVLGVTRIDPDFGYRLRNGQLILEQGYEFFKNPDPYSYTMPSYHFVEHAWFSALVIAVVYKIVGTIGLSFVWSLMAVAALLISVSRAKKGYIQTKHSKYLGNALFLLSVLALLSPFAIRVQVISWLLVSLLLYVLLNDRLWKKFRFLLPLYFLFWVNLHGSFVAGLAILFVVLAVRWLGLNKLSGNLGNFKNFFNTAKGVRPIITDKKDILVLALSFLATFINPYTEKLWFKVGTVTTAGSLRWEIKEWMPAFFVMTPFSAVFLATSVFFVYKMRNKFKFEEIVLFLGFLLQGLLSVRHYPLFILVALPMVMEGVNEFFSEIKKIKLAGQRIKTAYSFFLLLSGAFLVMSVYFSAKGTTGKDYYPENALVYLNGNSSDGEIFSTYNWAGYLTWKLPEKKIFVSGFMPLWSRIDAPDDESNNAYEEYSRVLSGEIDYAEVFEKYDIDRVLWYISREPRKIEELSLRILTFLGKENKNFNIITELEKDGWQKIYEDSVAVIYKKPQ